jgi:glucose/arabinose dehydrogenase
MIRMFVLAIWPAAVMAQVEQGPPNADFTPAFEGQTRAQALPTSAVDVAVLAEGLDSPWGIAPLGEGQFLVTERTGQMRIVRPDGQLSAPLRGLPDVDSDGQGGLLDVAVSPWFAQDRTIFWTYAKPFFFGSVTAAARGTLTTDGAVTDVVDIFVQDPRARTGRHFGSRILPMPDGTVWITTGDRGAGDGGTLVQDIETTHGKVIRVNADGSAPADNPYVGKPGHDLVWSLGHRNMQGAAIRPGGLWTIEHGPRGGDELNRPEVGRNYGWPVVSYGVNYDGTDIGAGLSRAPGFEEPVYYWDPVIAPAGMMFYDGPHVPWQGDLLIGSLNPGGLVRLKFEDGRVTGEERLLPQVGRVRDVEVVAGGDVLLLTDAGEVLRVTPR